MKMHCPHCGVTGSADDSYIGRKVRCPKCDTEFRCQEDRSTTDVDSESAWSPESSVLEEIPASVELSEAERIASEAAQDTPPAEELPLSQEEYLSPLEHEPDRFLDGNEACRDVIREEEPPVAVMEEEVEAHGDIDTCGKDADIASEIVPPDSTPSATEQEPAVSAETVLSVERKEPGEIESEAEPELTRDAAGATSPSEVHPPVEEALFAKPGDASASATGGGAEGRTAAAALPALGIQPKPNFTIGEALTDAWQRTKGAKGTVWGAMGVMYLVMLVLGFGLVYLQMSSGLSPESTGGVWLGIGIDALTSAVSTLFTAGLMYIGVCLAAERSCSWRTIVEGFPVAVQLLVATILMSLLIVSGLILLVLPGIYLAVGYTLTLPLMLDRRLGPWEAMEKSRKAIHKVWWRVFGLFLVMGLITAVSAIPLGIGLIWTLPMNVVLCGVVYRYLFGVQANKS
jgi:uncharacterized membrane protein/transcription elongation factor Elf1